MNPNPSDHAPPHGEPDPISDRAEFAGSTDFPDDFVAPPPDPNEVPAPPPQADATSDDAPLEHVVDDLAPKESAADWVLLQVQAGRSPDEVTADLLARGWPSADADEIVEFVRRATRGERGVVTREEVARRTRAKATASTRRVRLIVFGGVCVVFAAAIYFAPALVGLGKGDAASPSGPGGPTTSPASAPTPRADDPSD